MLVSLSFSQTLMQERPTYYQQLTRHNRSSPNQRFLKMRKNNSNFRQYETLGQESSAHSSNENSRQQLKQPGRTTQASEHLDPYLSNPAIMISNQSSTDALDGMHLTSIKKNVQRSASLATYLPKDNNQQQYDSYKPFQQQTAIFDSCKKQTHNYYKNFNMKAAYGIATASMSVTQNSAVDLNSQSRSRSQAEITGNNIMQAVNNYKPLQRINLKRKRNSKEGESKGSYKLKIINQMDDDVQFLDSCEFFDPVAAEGEDDHLSNEDLQTVAPSVVRDSAYKKLLAKNRMK